MAAMKTAAENTHHHCGQRAIDDVHDLGAHDRKHDPNPEALRVILQPRPKRDARQSEAPLEDERAVEPQWKRRDLAEAHEERGENGNRRQRR